MKRTTVASRVIIAFVLALLSHGTAHAAEIKVMIGRSGGSL
jgi:hypothetical protein